MNNSINMSSTDMPESDQPVQQKAVLVETSETIRNESDPKEQNAHADEQSSVRVAKPACTLEQTRQRDGTVGDATVALNATQARSEPPVTFTHQDSSVLDVDPHHFTVSFADPIITARQRTSESNKPRSVDPDLSRREQVDDFLGIPHIPISARKVIEHKYSNRDSLDRWLPPGFRREVRQDLADRYAVVGRADQIESVYHTSPVMDGEELRYDEFDRRLTDNWRRRIDIRGRSYYINPISPEFCVRTFCTPLGPEVARLRQTAHQFEGNTDSLPSEVANWCVCLQDTFGNNTDLRTLAETLASMEQRSKIPGSDPDQVARCRRLLPALKDGYVNSSIPWLPILAFSGSAKTLNPRHVGEDHDFVSWLRDLKQLSPDPRTVWVLEIYLPWVTMDVKYDRISKLLNLLFVAVILGLQFPALERLLNYAQQRAPKKQDLPGMMNLVSGRQSSLVMWPRAFYGLQCVFTINFGRGNIFDHHVLDESFTHIPPVTLITSTEALYYTAWRWLCMHWDRSDRERSNILRLSYEEEPTGGNEDWATVWRSVMDLKVIGTTTKSWIPRLQGGLHHRVNAKSAANGIAPSFWQQQFDNQFVLTLQEAALCTEMLEMHNTRLSRQAAEQSLRAAQLSIEEAHMVGRITLLAYIFLPITLVTGVFGMNISPFAGEGGPPMWQFWIVAPCLVVPAWLFGLYTIREQCQAMLRRLRIYWIIIFGRSKLDVDAGINQSRRHWKKVDAENELSEGRTKTERYLLLKLWPETSKATEGGV